MIIFKLCFFIAYFVFCEGNSFYSELSSNLQRINTPEGLGNFLQEQLAKNESRSLSEPCWQHIKEYAKGLLTFRFWAIRMFDATARFPSGFFRGNAAALGTFDECIEIQKTSKKFGTINGKYCLGVLELIKVTPSKKNIMDFSDEQHEQSVMEPEPKLVNLVRTSVGLPWGVCLPDSCSAKDFRLMYRLFFLRFTEEDCQTQASQYTTFDYSDIGALIFFGIIAGLIAGSTLYEIFMNYKRKGQGSALFKSFSILTNGSKIFRNDGNKETSCVHGIKCINFLVLTLGYRYVLHVFLPLDNWVTLVKWVLDYIQLFELVAILDTYFVVSAMLISYNYLKYREKGTKFNIIYYYLNRIIRFTVPFAAIILFNATLLRHIGSGPVWLRSRDYMFVKNCRDNWWTSLLYIQNYAHPYFTDMCVIQAFHLSVEMQLFILSPIFLIPLLQHPMFVISALLFLLFCAMVACFLHVWVFNIRSLILSFRSLQQIIDYLRYVFLATHSRASAWIIGFILGYIIFKSKDTKIPVKKVQLVFAVLFLWIASMTIIVMSCIVADEFKSNTLKYEYNWLTHAFHRTLIHPLWALAIAWIIFACAKGYGGPVNSFLSAYIFQVISRISYSTFLTNLTLISLLSFQTRIGVDFSDLATIHKACADLLLCLALGFVWTISFESPFVNITKVTFKKFEKKETLKV